MFALVRKTSVIVSVVLALSLAACGGSGGGGGNDQDVGSGEIVLTGFLPQPIQGCGPVPFTILGQNFETIVGTTAQVTFRAIDGTTPFLGGDSDRATVTANVTSDTTIEGLTPPILVCGVPSITAEVDVMLESGVQKTSTGIFTVTFNAPVIQAINPNPIPAAIPTAFTITGTGFGPVGGPVTIRFTGDAGALLFKDGTKNFADVFGQVVNSTTITGITPIATVCDVDQVGASIQLFFPDGCCSQPTSDGFVQFTAPVITSVSSNPVPAAIQQVGWTINGANFGPVNTIATVRFLSSTAGVALFDDGTTPTIDVPGLVTNGGNSIVLTTPLAAVCGVASRGAALRVISPFGSSCDQTVPNFVTFVAPAITTPTSSPATVPGAIPTSIQITGTNFGPVNASVVVRFTAEGGFTLFDDGTTVDVDAIGIITGANTVTVTTPLATVCGVASRAARVRVFAPAGGACADSAASYVTFQAPTFTSLSPTPVAAYPAPGTQFTLTGAGFGPAGSPASVTFRGDNGANLFGNGSLNEVTVLGTVANATTITGVLPTATVCGATSATASVRIELQNGSCVASGASAVTFNAPTVTGFSQPSVPASIPTAITIQGSGFGPTGGFAQVVFISDPVAPAIFGDGTLVESAPILGTVTGAGTINVLTPHATVLGAAQRAARVRVTLSNGSCATSVATLAFTAPALTTVAGPTGGAAQFNAAVPTAFVINGSNFGPVGSEVTVRFTDTGPGTRFANATSATFDVPGTVQSPTVISATAPLVALCPQASMPASIAVYFQDGSRASNTLAITYVAPVITTFATTPSPWVAGAAVPFTITGTNFGPAGSLASVKFTAISNVVQTPFGGGTLNEITVTGNVVSATTITGRTPVAILCAVSALNVNVMATFQGGACTNELPALLTGPGDFEIVDGEEEPVSGVPAWIPTPLSITGTGFPPVGTPVTITLRAQGGALPFGAGTSQQQQILTVVSPANTIGFTTPLATICSNATVDVLVAFGNAVCPPTNVGPLTLRAPTVTGFATDTAANTWTFSGNDWPAVGTLVGLRLTALGGVTPFAGGTQNQFDVLGTVGPANQVTIQRVRYTLCGAAGFSMNAALRFANAPCEVAFASNPINVNAPSFVSATPASVPALVPTTTALAFTGYAPWYTAVNSPVVVHFIADTPIFADGTSTSIAVAGVVTQAGPVPVDGVFTVTTPSATLCGVASAAARVRVEIPGGTCFTTGNVLTFNAPRLAATPATAFAPQNLPYAGGPFTITGLGTPNVFAPAGGVVSVRFRATDGSTPFAGGTSDTAYVPGTIVDADTITGVAPAVSVAISNVANDIPDVEVTVQFEDGSCTDTTTTSYWRITRRLAVVSGGNVEIIDWSTMTVVDTLAVSGNDLADVTIDPARGRLYATDPTAETIEVWDLNAGTVAGTPVPAFAASFPTGTNPTGIVADPRSDTLYVIESDAIVARKGSSGLGLWTGVGVDGLTGRLELDPDNDQVLAAALPAEADPILVVLDTNLNLNGALIPISPIGNASWTGGFALDTQRNVLWLTYTDTDPAGEPAGLDFIEARPSSVPTVALNIQPTLNVSDNPTAVLAVEPKSARLAVQLGTGVVEFYDVDAFLVPLGGSLVSTGTLTPANPYGAMVANEAAIPSLFASDPTSGAVDSIDPVTPSFQGSVTLGAGAGALHAVFTGTSP